jgi:hypothetical protein
MCWVPLVSDHGHLESEDRRVECVRRRVGRPRAASGLRPIHNRRLCKPGPRAEAAVSARAGAGTIRFSLCD